MTEEEERASELIQAKVEAKLLRCDLERSKELLRMAIWGVNESLRTEIQRFLK